MGTETPRAMGGVEKVEVENANHETQQPTGFEHLLIVRAAYQGGFYLEPLPTSPIVGKGFLMR